MVTFPIKNILTIFLAFAICYNCQSIDNPGGSSSWAKLQISPDTLSSMEYGNFLIEIYEHDNNQKATTTASQKKYFYSPLALLDHSSAVSIYNNVTNQAEMRFRVEMWNDKVQNEVVKHLNKYIGQEIQSDKVRVIPLEKVILTSNIPTADYSLSPVWTIYDKRKTLWFSLSCYDPKICNKLANEMRSNPQQFDHFKLLYSLSSQTSQTKQTTISIDSVTSGQMVSTLLQKFKDKKEIFLTASDEKKMLTETATNIRMDSFDDSEVLSPDTEFQILNILKDLLVTYRTIIKEQSDKMWDSVFWNDDNYRPDKTTKTLNEIINKFDRETQKRLADMFQKMERQSEITEKLTSNDEDGETRQEEEFRTVNQSEDANENEMRRSKATDQEQTSRNKTRDDKSTTSRDDTNVTAGGLGVKVGVKVAINNNHTHNSEQENEKTDKSKINSDEYGRNSENKEGVHHNYDLSSWDDVDRISSTISGKMANDSDSSRRVDILKEEVEKLLQESKDNVQWDGEKFVPKPMQLSRINLGKFRDSQSFQDRNVRVRYTTAELSAPIKIMEHAEMTVTDEWNNIKEELKETKKELIKTRTDLTKNLDSLSIKFKATEKELAHTKITVGNLLTELKTRTSEIVDIGQMPTSCADLQRMGHKLSGFFSVKGSKKMEMIYCNFNADQNDKQKWIGYADVKSAPVHFHVQRNSSFDTKHFPIPFELARVNEGNAMNLTSGIFTAPRPGIYFFSFTGVARISSASPYYFYAHLVLNGDVIGTSFVREDRSVTDIYTPLTLQSKLNLKKDDQVWVAIYYYGSSLLYDYPGSHYTHFTGFMLEEEIVASL